MFSRFCAGNQKDLNRLKQFCQEEGSNAGRNMPDACRWLQKVKAKWKLQTGFKCWYVYRFEKKIINLINDELSINRCASKYHCSLLRSSDVLLPPSGQATHIRRMLQCPLKQKLRLTIFCHFIWCKPWLDVFKTGPLFSQWYPPAPLLCLASLKRPGKGIVEFILESSMIWSLLIKCLHARWQFNL